ncbi:chaperone protein dnaJ 11, chloroplastic-like [Impatiens glandulifera]|uniref:chaperone protein dnaJ 11, chloroplastic-like n=1 Tax=Impatiens glandulifera TaxID=253017 RepID=UPI001FB0B893|nr:chaperone protein dnaJ 11, chloroplastic-like [Impatiens glandulifera]
MCSSTTIFFIAAPFLGGAGTKFASRSAVPTTLKFRRAHNYSSIIIHSSSTFYEVLGIEAGATSQDIKKAYRNLARAVHPDVAPASSNGSESSADLFIKIHVAYSTLSDPGKRYDYDRKLCQRRQLCGQPRRNWETDQCW